MKTANLEKMRGETVGNFEVGRKLVMGHLANSWSLQGLSSPEGGVYLCL